MTVLTLTGLLVGAAYGFVSQRGAFCMNSGFRVVVTQRDFTKVKAYGLAIAIQMLVVPVILAVGLAEPTYPSLFPVGALVGGLLFGASMSWAGGCAAGVWFKVGAANLGAVAAVVGMALGAASLEVGPLEPFRTSVQSLGAGRVPADLGALWALAPIVGTVLLVALLRASSGSAGHWSWQRTGVLIGIVGSLAWPLSSLAGREFGMAVIPGTVGLVADPLHPASLGTWDVMFVLGIPAGSLLGARLDGPVKWVGIDRKALAKRFVGGAGLGVGASLAAGCTVGHGLTGLPLLAPGSLVAMVAIFAGSAGVAWLTRK